MENKKQKIIIVGGGSTGWISAATLSKKLKPELYDITLIESSTIGTIGVGEAVIRTFVNFIKSLGINEFEFMQATQASFKLGIEFRDWHTQGEHYFHHFGGLGHTINNLPFFQCWLKARVNGDRTPLESYAPACIMSQHKRFDLPAKAAKGSPISGANYAYHFDASLVAKFLRNFSENRGVKCIDARVTNVIRKGNGDIESLKLDNGDNINGDLFLDCSGFRGVLINEALESPFENWQQYLPCDRAVTLQTEAPNDIAPYTVSTARDNGWTWRIPLQHRIGNGYVFSSRFCSDDEAISTLRHSVEGTPIQEPSLLSFQVGRRDQLWKNNCIALGLAGGFIEPLESTAIHLVTRGLQFLISLFPHNSLKTPPQSSLAKKYNHVMHKEYAEIRDFIVLHYCTTQREDTPFWQHCKTMDIPQGLAEKIELFKHRGKLRVGSNDLFRLTSWEVVLTGMNIIPRTYHPFVDFIDFNNTQKVMQGALNNLEESVALLPSHRDFLNTNCKALEMDTA